MDGTAVLEIKEHLKQYVILTEDKTTIEWFVNPYNGNKFDHAGSMNFDLGNYGDKKGLPRADIAYLASLPAIPKRIKTKDTMK